MPWESRSVVVLIALEILAACAVDGLGLLEVVLALVGAVMAFAVNDRMVSTVDDRALGMGTCALVTTVLEVCRA